MAQRGRGRGAAAWEAAAARMEAAERERAARRLGRGRGAALAPAPGVVAAGAGVVGAGRGGAGGGPGAVGVGAIGAAGHGGVGAVAAAAAAGNGAGGGGAGRGGRAAATGDRALGLWLRGNTNHGVNRQKVPSQYGVAIDPKELVIYSADEYLTGDAEVDDLYKRLASFFNTHGDHRVLMFEKAAEGQTTQRDQLNYKMEKARLMEKIGELQVSLRNHNAKPYPVPKIFSNDPPF